MPWSAQVHAKFHVYRITQGIHRRCLAFGYGSFTLCGATFHPLHLAFHLPHLAPTTPEGNLLVWTFPLSFATTDGIAFAFFSSPY